jgi:hypothetical protein
MIAKRPALLAVCALALSMAAVAIPSAHARTAHSAAACRVLKAPKGLGATFRTLHLTYLRHRPDTHNPSIRGPLGTIRDGRCGTTDYALASFSQTYNGLNFGETDQPEYFTKAAGHGWRDRGNAGGEPCDTAPHALLRAWHFVSCPS